MGERLTHFDETGSARMVDVGDKVVTRRECVARATVRMAPATLAAIRDGRAAKGDVLALARIAGVQAAKRTSEWIPLAHPLPLDVVEMELQLDEAASCVHIEACVRAHAKTGVEMEALVAATAAGLTLYDMCKAIDRGMTIDAVRLVRKSGGKSGEWQRPDEDAPPR
jgi:cyclic pyranopterin phosphate synthase